MSVCNNNCTKTTADSTWDYSKSYFLDISDDDFIYNIFDENCESIHSSNIIVLKSQDLTLCLDKIKKLKIDSIE